MTSSPSPRSRDAAVGALLLFVTLWFLWPLTDAVTWLITPGYLAGHRLWVVALIAGSLLAGASTYLREPSLLWQIPLQALAAALILSGLPRLLDCLQSALNHRHLSVSGVAVSIGCIAAGVFLAMWMKKLKHHYLIRRRTHLPRSTLGREAVGRSAD